MPRRKSLVTVIRDMVQEQVREAIQELLGAPGPKKKPANGRRRRRRGRRFWLIWIACRARLSRRRTSCCSSKAIRANRLRYALRPMDRLR